jgi:exo-1,4-beta-D-glucosaminidase
MDKHFYRFLLFAVLLIVTTQSFGQTKKDNRGVIQLKEGWMMQQSTKVNKPGSEISSGNLNTTGWFKTQVSSTVMGSLTRNGLYKDILFGENYKDIDKSPFDDSWWYRKEFRLSTLVPGNQVILHFDGLNYYANIWLNGRQIASRDSVFGPYRRYEINITNLVREDNVLAVEVFKAKAGDFNLGFVDWNPRPVDENMGIWRGVYVEVTGSVSLENVYVKSKVNTTTLKEASLFISADLNNHSTKQVSGMLKGSIGKTEFSYPVTLKPGESRRIGLDPAIIPSLKFINPRLWWCNNLGSPELYKLDLAFEVNAKASDKKTVTFGIREIECYTNPAGHKGFKLNGKDILVKGAGWADDIFLRDSIESLETQVQYVKHMNLNTIRFESIWGTSQEIYDLCDKYGLLVMVGWSCQWEWDEYLGKPCDNYGGIQTESEISLVVHSFRDQLLWLRNHPSIFVWMVGSDKCPKPELEKQYADLISTLDNRPYLSAASTRTSEVSGPTGVKMNGPYEYVAPNYWYVDTINGGAFGFNTETGPGPQVPVLESIKKMIPADKLWPLNDTWNYHCTHSNQAFNTMDVFNKALYARFGKPTTLADYLNKADAQGYEALKAMFEAFRTRIPNTTGIIQWMLNSAWPSLFWQLYDYNLLPTSAYYAARKANAPIQLIYDYGSRAIYAVDELNEPVAPGSIFKASLTWLNASSEAILKKVIDVNLKPNSSTLIFKPDSIKGASFLSLKLYDQTGKQLAENFYWLSDKPDEFAWDKTYWAFTPMKDYADYNYLNALPYAKVKASCKKSVAGNNSVYEVELDNQSNTIAFFLNLSVLDSKGSMIFPLFWEDNYFSILPGEKRTVLCAIPLKTMHNANPGLFLSGWNVEKQQIEIR